MREISGKITVVSAQLVLLLKTTGDMYQKSHLMVLPLTTIPSKVLDQSLNNQLLVAVKETGYTFDTFQYVAVHTP